MKQFMLSLCLLFMASGVTAQKSYQQALAQGDAAFKTGQYKLAINKYISAEAFEPTQKEAVRERLNRVYDTIQVLKTRAEAAQKQQQRLNKQLLSEQQNTQQALDKAEREKARYEKLVNAFYFYEGRFALAFKEGHFYFMDRESNRVNKLGQWGEAEQFNRQGLARVKIRTPIGATSYYIDTFGKKFRGIFDTEEYLRLINTPLTFPDTSVYHGYGVPCPPYCDFDAMDTTVNFQVLKLQGPSEKIGLKKIVRHQLSRFRELEQLELSGFFADSLPEEIGDLHRLRELNLHSNQFSFLPPELGALETLQILDVSRNKVKQLPRQLFQLRKLTELHLTGNQISYLPDEISNLQNLQVLNVLANKLDSLPASIGQISTLTGLNAGSNNLKALPLHFFDLKELTGLSLYMNKLTELPAEIGNLTKLTRFNISRNLIGSLPSTIGRLTVLVLFQAEDCGLKALPKEIGRLAKMETLYLRNNQIKELPPEIGEMQGLKFLDIRNNQLTKLPPEIVKLKNLKSLSLNGNPIPAAEVEALKKLLPNCYIGF